MPTPTRFPKGITNVDANALMAQLPMPYPPALLHTYFEDFDYYTAADWTITRVGTTPTEALTDVDNGVLLLTMAATDDSSSFLQKKGESFLPASGKKMFFEARASPSATRPRAIGCWACR